MNDLQSHVGHELAEGYRALMWQTFFAERRRGYALDDHFPAGSTRSSVVSYVTLRSGTEIVAGMVIRALPKPAPSVQISAAEIGFVCVAEPHRGRGLSKYLMEKGIAELEASGIDAFTLWTSKPGVYKPHGFETADAGLSGWVVTPQASNQEHRALGTERWPGASERCDGVRGLPPYASGAQRVYCNATGASVIVLTDPFGWSVVEWAGPDVAVAQMLIRYMPPRWRLHAREGDRLPAALEAAGATLNLSTESAQMWRAPGPLEALTRLFPLRLLDRI